MRSERCHVDQLFEHRLPMSFNNNKVLREDFASEAVHFDFMIMRMFLFIKVLVFVYFYKQQNKGKNGQ